MIIEQYLVGTHTGAVNMRYVILLYIEEDGLFQIKFQENDETICFSIESILNNIEDNDKGLFKELIELYPEAFI